MQCGMLIYYYLTYSIPKELKAGNSSVYVYYMLADRMKFSFNNSLVYSSALP